MKLKLYDLITKLLEENPELRVSDRKLIWEVWKYQKVATNAYITKEAFLEMAELPENIRRCRQKIQELHPELKVSRSSKKESDKGTFVFRERVPIFDNVNNTVVFKYES